MSMQPCSSSLESATTGRLTRRFLPRCWTTSGVLKLSGLGLGRVTAGHAPSRPHNDSRQAARDVQQAADKGVVTNLLATCSYYIGPAEAKA